MSENGTCPHCAEELPSDYQMRLRYAVDKPEHEIKLATLDHRFSEGHSVCLYAGRFYRLLECRKGDRPQIFWQTPGGKDEEPLAQKPDEFGPTFRRHTKR